MSSTSTAGTWDWRRLLVEPRRPAAVRERPDAHWLAVAAVCVGALMGQLDASIVTVALPSLQRSFGASVGSVTWVGLSYLLVLVATVTAVGRFADMWGRKLLYVYGFVVFVVASVLCGLAPDLAALCGFRALQAVGAAMLQANSLAIIVLVVPARSLGRALGLQGAAQAIGLALGPTVGGLLLSVGGWRLIFFVNVPFGVFGAVAALMLVPRSQNLLTRRPFDWRGLALFLPCVAALLSALSFGATSGWTSPLIVGLFAATVLLGVGFVRHARTTPSPMLDVSLFANRRFSAGIVSGMGSYLVMFGVLLLVPFYLERGLGLSAARAGLELMALPVCFGVVAPLAGRLADRVGARPLAVSGMALVSGGLLLAALLRPTGTGPFVVLLAVIGAGLGLFTSPNNAAIMGAAPPQQAGMASGLLNMTRGMGTALGLALTGLVFATAGGSGGHMAAHAFTVAALVLALVAALSCVVAGLRSNGTLNTSAAKLAD
ncbi:MAG TPA: DHA2 family efflux MFS transporter permease subunit [Acidimicrobiales bacterium]|jgi:EmrB/QacA subfamily drug resistance transporter|nr:DHA2 family efflux MFS transporter permease subunit [Acidimicrobiales bacterium]